MSVQVTRHLFTVEEYYNMLTAGILTENDRVELIAGEIVAKSPIGIRHAACVKRLNNLFARHLNEEAIISIQNPIHLDKHSQPEPDVALLRPRPDFYAHAHPEPKDVLLAIEVADTSLAYDQDVKIPLYGRAGISETWLVDLENERLLVYRQPSPQGYRQLNHLWPGDDLTPQALAEITLTVDAILG